MAAEQREKGIVALPELPLFGGQARGAGALDVRRAAGIAPATAATAIDAITVLLEGLGDGLDDDTAVLALSVPSPPGDPGARPRPVDGERA